MKFVSEFSFGIALFIATLVCCIEASPISSKQNAQCTTEDHRPRYHFSAKKNWLNDPNGMVYYDGVYHLYYQHHPDGMTWGPMHWGHATSRDLVTWEELPIALYPDELGTIFSGSSVVDFANTTGFKPSPDSRDPIVAIYTSAGAAQSQSIAYSLDDGLTFTKYEANPVLNATETPDFRDPKVFYHDNRWIMSLAVWDRIEFFSSPDLKRWTKESEFGRNPPEGSHGGVWECPDLIPVNVENSSEQLWVLLVSINPGGPNGGSATQYFIGNVSDTENGLQFQGFPWSPNQWMDWGPDNYAGVTFSNEPKGRQIYMGWMTNWAYAEATPNIAHRGQMTIPRQFSIRALDRPAGQYRLISNPVPELESLRDPLQHLEHNEPFQVAPQNVVVLTEQANFTNPLMELEINLEVRGNPQLSICAFNDLSEEVCFGLNTTEWYLDRTKSGNTGFHDNFRNSLHPSAAREINNELITIKLYLDVSSLEAFADDGLTTMTALHYPTRPFDKFYINHWSEASSSATVRVNNFNVWGLQCWFPENESTKH